MKTEAVRYYSAGTRDGSAGKLLILQAKIDLIEWAVSQIDKRCKKKRFVGIVPVVFTPHFLELRT